jgi:hypothetical protein
MERKEKTILRLPKGIFSLKVRPQENYFQTFVLSCEEPICMCPAIDMEGRACTRDMPQLRMPAWRDEGGGQKWVFP